MRKLLISSLLATGLAVPIGVGSPTTGSPVLADTAPVSSERADLGTEAFVPITPERVLDTRIGLGAAERPLGPGETITLQLGGVAGIPSDVAGVVMNVTSIQSSEPSFITVWPAGQERPGTSNLNTEPGQNTPNLVIVGTGAGGAVQIFNRGGTVHLATDVTAYLPSASTITPLPPSRILDTRDGTGTFDEPFGTDETRTLPIHGRGGVPSDAAAVVMNVTSTQATERSFVTVWPSGNDRPVASTLNTEPGQNTPNLAIVAIGQGGSVDLYNKTGSTHLVGDVMGYLPSGSGIVTDSPARFLDTRDGTGTNGRTGPVGAEETIDVQVAGTRGIPAEATAVVVNVTSNQATSPSFVTAWPTGEARPNASTLNTEVGQSTPNLAVVKVGADGRISLFNRRGSTHLIVDVAGWFVPTSTQPLIDELDVFQGEGARTTTNFLLSRISGFGWNTSTRTINADTTAGAFATAEDFSAFARLHSTFEAQREDAELSFDIDWSGTMTSFVGAAANAEVTITIGVYEVSQQGIFTVRGPEVWSETLENTGVGAALQAIAVDQVSGSISARRQLPSLDVGGTYRVEAEVHCNTRVTFSVGATSCDFTTGDRGVTVNDWTLEYGPVA